MMGPANNSGGARRGTPPQLKMRWSESTILTIADNERDSTKTRFRRACARERIPTGERRSSGNLNYWHTIRRRALRARRIAPIDRAEWNKARLGVPYAGIVNALNGGAGRGAEAGSNWIRSSSEIKSAISAGDLPAAAAEAGAATAGLASGATTKPPTLQSGPTASGQT